MYKKIMLATAFGLMASVVSTTIFAADGAGLFVSKGCAACHGAGGAAPIIGSYPKLAGQNAAYLVTQMKDIKSGARSNGQTVVMKPIIASVSNDEINAIAHYLSSEK